MITPSNIAELKSFVLDFGQFLGDLQSKYITERKVGLSEFMRGFGEIYPRWEREERRIASSFNLFSILNIRHLETRLHTPLLCNLLSPSGSHWQGGLFLNRFLETVFPGDSLFEKVDTKFIQVHEELFTGEKGRIDIVIHYSGPPNPFVIIIENKIFAQDQENQLERYYNYAQSVLHLPDERIRLVYLTLWGNPPEDESWISKEKEKSDAGQSASIKLYCIAYRTHILDWLGDLMDEIEAPVVHETMRQYVGAIKYLTS